MVSPGYIADHGWKYTYHYNLCPGYLRFALAMAGCPAPAMKHVCDLAYGQGVSLVLHAACNQTITWSGTDFNPHHVAFASRLAGQSASNLTLYDLPLGAFSSAACVDAIDVFTNIGTWTWISPSDQQAVITLLRDRLSATGLFCLAHTTLPGQDGLVGLSRIFASLGQGPELITPPAPELIPEALRTALAFLDTNPSFLGIHSNLRVLTQTLATQDPSHLAHEYFNYQFRPGYFLDLAVALSAAGVGWAAPWSASRDIDCLHLTARQDAFLQGIERLERREQLRDLMLNTGMRTDIFAKSAHAVKSARLSLLTEMAFVLVVPVASVPSVVSGGLGELALAKDLYVPLLAKLAAHKPVTISALHACLQERYSMDEVADAVAILVDANCLHVVKSDADDISLSTPKAHALNLRILQMSRDGDTVRHLGSPLTGGGIELSRSQRLFLLAHAEGARDVDSYARAAEPALAAKQSGATPPDGTLLRRDAKDFMDRFLPIYRSLALIPDLER